MPAGRGEDITIRFASKGVRGCLLRLGELPPNLLVEVEDHSDTAGGPLLRDLDHQEAAIGTDIVVGLETRLSLFRELHSPQHDFVPRIRAHL